jgi:hypothetical protein
MITELVPKVNRAFCRRKPLDQPSLSTLAISFSHYHRLGAGVGRGLTDG